MSLAVVRSINQSLSEGFCGSLWVVYIDLCGSLWVVYKGLCSSLQVVYVGLHGWSTCVVYIGLLLPLVTPNNH